MMAVVLICVCRVAGVVEFNRVYSYVVVCTHRESCVPASTRIAGNEGNEKRRNKKNWLFWPRWPFLGPHGSFLVLSREERRTKRDVESEK